MLSYRELHDFLSSGHSYKKQITAGQTYNNSAGALPFWPFFVARAVRSPHKKGLPYRHKKSALQLPARRKKLVQSENYYLSQDMEILKHYRILFFSNQLGKIRKQFVTLWRAVPLSIYQMGCRPVFQQYP